jgi:NADH:ubiquinone oxidoreductase subunit 5 (subunit L)/multisubunit Na+/H+ antiporter MnhA subunit
VAVVFVIAATLTLLYMLRLYYKVFLAAPAAKFETHKSSIWSPMNFSVAFLAFISLIGGLSFNWLSQIASLAAIQIFGVNL